jgi:uncharacterized protein (TIGR00369 family)
MAFHIQNPDYASLVRSVFGRAPFITDLGIRLLDVGEGVCETELDVAPRHLQQDRVVHAGVSATMGDHTAGGAAATLVRPDEGVLTIEFKINLLRAAIGDKLRCRATVLRQGRTVIVAESEIFTRDGARESLVAKQMVTLAVVTASA